MWTPPKRRTKIKSRPKHVDAFGKSSQDPGSTPGASTIQQNQPARYTSRAGFFVLWTHWTARTAWRLLGAPPSRRHWSFFYPQIPQIAADFFAIGCLAVPGISKCQGVLGCLWRPDGPCARFPVVVRASRPHRRMMSACGAKRGRLPSRRARLRRPCGVAAKKALTGGLRPEKYHMRKAGSIASLAPVSFADWSQRGRGTQA